MLVAVIANKWYGSRHSLSRIYIGISPLTHKPNQVRQWLGSSLGENSGGKKGNGIDYTVK